MVPINVGLDFTAIDVPRVDVTDQLLAFEEANDLGVYIYQWEEDTDGRSAYRVSAAHLLASASWNAYCSYTGTTTYTCDISSANVLH